MRTPKLLEIAAFDLAPRHEPPAAVSIRARAGEPAAFLPAVKPRHEGEIPSSRLLARELDPYLPPVLADIVGQYHCKELDNFIAAVDGVPEESFRNEDRRTSQEALDAWLDAPSAQTLACLVQAANKLGLLDKLAPLVARQPWNPAWAEGLSAYQLEKLALANPGIVDRKFASSHLSELVKMAFLYKAVPLQQRLFDLFPAGDPGRRALIDVLSDTATLWSDRRSVDFVLDRLHGKAELSRMLRRCVGNVRDPESVAHLCDRIVRADFTPQESAELCKPMVDWSCLPPHPPKGYGFLLANDARNAVNCLAAILRGGNFPDGKQQQQDAWAVARKFLGECEVAQLIDILVEAPLGQVRSSDLESARTVVKLLTRIQMPRLITLGLAIQRLEAWESERDARVAARVRV